VLSLKKNGLGTKEAGKALGEMLKGNSVLKELDLSENIVSSYDGGDAAGFAQELADGIKDNGAMAVLDVSKNNLWAPGLKHLAEAPAHNQTLTELDISENSATRSVLPLSWGGDMSGIIALANAIPDMGALSALIFGGGTYGGAALNAMENVTPGPATPKAGMTEADLSNKKLGAGGAIIISAWITHKDKGALSVLNLASTNMGELVLPEGWTKGPNADISALEYSHTDGS
jgi:hypothetical protein